MFPHHHSYARRTTTTPLYPDRYPQHSQGTSEDLQYPRCHQGCLSDGRHQGIQWWCINLEPLWRLYIIELPYS